MPSTVRLLRELRLRDHDARIETREEGRDEQHRAGAGHRERPAAPAGEGERDGEDEDDDRGGGREDGREDVLVVPVDRHPDRPDEEGAGDERRRERESARGVSRPLEQVAGRLQRQEDRPVEGEEQHRRQPGENGVRAEEIPEAPGVMPVRVDREAVDEVREAHAPDEWGSDAPDRVRPHPGRPPARAVALLAPLEGDDADDQEDEHEQEREVEAREHRPVPAGKAAKVAAPATTSQTSFPSQTGPIVSNMTRRSRSSFGQERQQHADPEVEALEQEIAGPEEGDEAEPEELEVHQYPSAGAASSPSPPAGAGSRVA